MASTSILLAFLFFVGGFAQDCSRVCQSFGKDFVDGGVYFQNALSTDPFTATEYFLGCQDDVAYNVLRDPQGNQYECNNTPLVPDGMIQNLTCPITKNQLITGQYAIIVLSNNGQCDPIDYIRTFSLDVGTQATTTIPPTVTVTSTSTPVITSTTTINSIITYTASAFTTTVRSANPHTVTITPLPLITPFTKAIISVTQTVLQPSVVTTKTTTMTTPCVNLRAANRIIDPSDKINTAISVTVIKDAQLTAGIARRNAVAEPTARAGSLEHRRAILGGRSPSATPELAQAEIRRRAPDAPTLTVTLGEPVSTTTIITAAPTTVLATITAFSTSTITPTVFVTSRQYLPVITTAPRQTLTATFYVPVTVVKTTKYATTLTVTSTAHNCVFT